MEIQLQTSKGKSLLVTKQEEPPFSLTYAKMQGWSNEEVMVFELNYKSLPIGRMSATTLIKQAKILLFKISVITGWPLPESEEEKQVLYDQFMKKLQEDYSALNVEEVEYAMRSIGTSVKDWGKNINLSMIDEVLIKYIHKRASVRELENNAIKKKNDPREIEPETDPDKYVEIIKTVYLRTKLRGLIPAECYDILEHRKDIDLTIEEKKAIKKSVEVSLKIEADKGSLSDQKEFASLKNNPDDYDQKVRNECKRYAVAQYFEKVNAMDAF